MNNSKWEVAGWVGACICMFLLAVVHTAYEMGTYQGTWVLCGVMCTCSMMALRPKYRTTCWNAVKYGTAAVLPLVAVAGAVALGVWFVHNPGWFLVTVIAGPILWAIGVSTDMQRRTPHHDSRPGSFYQQSQRKQWDNSK